MKSSNDIQPSLVQHPLEKLNPVEAQIYNMNVRLIFTTAESEKRNAPLLQHGLPAQDGYEGSQILGLVGAGRDTSLVIWTDRYGIFL